MADLDDLLADADGFHNEQYPPHVHALVADLAAALRAALAARPQPDELQASPSKHPTMGEAYDDPLGGLLASVDYWRERAERAEAEVESLRAALVECVDAFVESTGALAWANPAFRRWRALANPLFADEAAAANPAAPTGDDDG